MKKLALVGLTGACLLVCQPQSWAATFGGTFSANSLLQNSRQFTFDLPTVEVYDDGGSLGVFDSGDSSFQSFADSLATTFELGKIWYSYTIDFFGTPFDVSGWFELGSIPTICKSAICTIPLLQFERIVSRADGSLLSLNDKLTIDVPLSGSLIPPEPAITPEPSTFVALSLLGLGLLGSRTIHRD